MHRSMSLLPRAALLFLLLSSTATPTWAAKCLFYTDREACERYTDSGSCIWNAQAAVCLDGGPSLPPETVGVAIVGLNPRSAPLEIKPGPSTSFGNVSLGNETELTVKFGEQKSFELDEDRLEGESELEESNPEETTEVLNIAEAPEAEANVFCTLPPLTGRCRGLIPRWYWDREEGRCVEFSFGGCGGNENNFASEEECEIAAQEYC